MGWTQGPPQWDCSRAYVFSAFSTLLFEKPLRTLGGFFGQSGMKGGERRGALSTLCLPRWGGEAGGLYSPGAEALATPGAAQGVAWCVVQGPHPLRRAHSRDRCDSIPTPEPMLTSQDVKGRREVGSLCFREVGPTVDSRPRGWSLPLSPDPRAGTAPSPCSSGDTAVTCLKRGACSRLRKPDIRIIIS